MTDPPSYHEASSTTNATTAANTTPHTACSRTIPDSDIFPTLESLAFPDRLLGQKPPYVLILEVENRVRIRMNSNHTPSLELIKAYFEKHTRRDNRVHTLPRHLKFDLDSSGYNFYALPQAIIDTLIISDRHQNVYTEKFGLSPSSLMAFIEGVLGYSLIACGGDKLYYRREKQFHENVTQ